MPQSQADQLALDAFEGIIPRWQEAENRSTHSLVRLQASQVAHNVGQGRASSTYQPLVPLVADFVADVQLCAYRVLQGEDLAHFNRHYRELALLQDDVQRKMRNMDLRVRLRVGRALIHAGIYPFGLYMMPIDTRVSDSEKQRIARERGWRRDS